jgi:hypothetical protein
MKREDNKIIFRDDNEFYDFAVSQHDVFNRTDGGILYHDWNFTSSYEKAVADGTVLVIEDPNSQVVKNQCACFRTICKPVEVKGASKMKTKKQ